ncbi:hypothetical protein Ddye_014466 [Dipteronia dyeriana]|uniref:Reverse transcriptase zinc-binding domain-containing protein n=1 Tax=Dipteronia dyeriana TaxID=168575 RepID=A0AAE0CKK0_9ROSI|nr:hypothetical protein Ddye_014466 [Dipteronia dyeriana]
MEVGQVVLKNGLFCTVLHKALLWHKVWAKDRTQDHGDDVCGAALPISYLGLTLGGHPGSKIFWVMGFKRGKFILLNGATLCKSKKEGGVGVDSVLNLNNGLLAKWVWRFNVESSPLWKRAICAKYGIQKDILRWDWAYEANSSVFTKSISKLLKNGSISAQILKEGVRVLVGKGDRAKLWSDIMVEGSSLKEAFPRIYALAMDKLGCIKNYRLRDGSEWEWEISLRRNLFDWEIDQWRCFLDCLMNTKVMDTVHDLVSWVPDSFGDFSVKYFRRCLENGHDQEEMIFKAVWLGICPPKIFLFAWQLLHGRVLVWEVLSKCGQVVVWSIWEARNQIIFKDILTDFIQVEDMVRYRVGWMSFQHNCLPLQELVIYLDLDQICWDGISQLLVILNLQWSG